MPRFEMLLPVEIRPLVSPLLHRLMARVSTILLNPTSMHGGLTSICSGVHISRSILLTTPSYDQLRTLCHA